MYNPLCRDRIGTFSGCSLERTNPGCIPLMPASRPRIPAPKGLPNISFAGLITPSVRSLTNRKESCYECSCRFEEERNCIPGS